MKYYINTLENSILEENQIHIVMYWNPIFYDDSAVFATVTTTNKGREYHTDINKLTQLNGPLSGPGEELGAPLADEWNGFLDDCDFLIRELGFTIISRKRSETSKKSEYFVVFGLDDIPVGSIVFDLRISDHPFDASFPEEAKDEALEYLKVNKILDGTATKAGIDFQVENVLVGTVPHDSWDRAFKRVFLKLKSMRRHVNALLRTKGIK